MKRTLLLSAVAAAQLAGAAPVLPGYLTDPSVLKDDGEGVCPFSYPLPVQNSTNRRPPRTSG